MTWESENTELVAPGKPVWTEQAENSECSCSHERLHFTQPWVLVLRMVLYTVHRSSVLDCSNQDDLLLSYPEAYFQDDAVFHQVHT